jgi:hypothetical protein
MRDEQRRREEPDRGERDVVVVGERIGDRADVRDVPGQAAADREPGDDASDRGGQSAISGRRR